MNRADARGPARPRARPPPRTAPRPVPPSSGGASTAAPARARRSGSGQGRGSADAWTALLRGGSLRQGAAGHKPPSPPGSGPDREAGRRAGLDMLLMIHVEDDHGRSRRRSRARSRRRPSRRRRRPPRAARRSGASVRPRSAAGRDRRARPPARRRAPDSPIVPSGCASAAATSRRISSSGETWLTAPIIWSGDRVRAPSSPVGAGRGGWAATGAAARQRTAMKGVRMTLSERPASLRRWRSGRQGVGLDMQLYGCI